MHGWCSGLRGRLADACCRFDPHTEQLFLCKSVQFLGVCVCFLYGYCQLTLVKFPLRTDAVIKKKKRDVLFRIFKEVFMASPNS